VIDPRNDAADPVVERAFADLTGSAQPDGQWQARVWARIARAPEEAKNRRRLRLWQGAATTLAVLMLVGGGLVYRLWQTDARAIEVESQAAFIRFRDEVGKMQHEIEQIIAQKDEAIEKRLAAGTEAERKNAEIERLQLERMLAAKRKALSELRDKQARKEAAARHEKAKRINTKCDPNDPLCGL